ncbi:MAG: c-type cytochrome [Acidimicrobiia bacterium]
MKRFVDAVQVLAVVVSIVFVIALFANDASTSGGGSGGGEATAEAPDGAPDGAAIFAGSCARCHGSDGSGGIGPPLSGGRAVDRFPDPADQIVVVTDGRGGMPAFEDNLTPEEIEAVVTFTREELG